MAVSRIAIAERRIPQCIGQAYRRMYPLSRDICGNRPRPVFEVSGTRAALVSGLTPTAYDLIHVGGWALIIAGVLLMIMGLIRYAAAARS
jgi:hypothetical protein